ncbi:hypothetical protein [Winogradskyella thalassocola]|uniref:Uncharacterized protein n=1 Tax=Winogradskyella thalassocola TaxID=262004 RepID=A0A1G7WTB0_9FLAO|nr:hypothetical protein [Winogradskyella thalassocola]SDG75149.1 hypothetical protein SAMN04489796_101482 [Winogradskyella thalassocola]
MFIKSKYIFVCLLALISCNRKSDSATAVISTVNESEYVINSNYTKGDVRRYGVFPNQKVNQSYLKNILELGDLGIKIRFPKGFYDTNLILKGQQDVSVYFDSAEFSGQVQIVDDTIGKPSQNITFKGKLKTYNKFFVRGSQNISIDTLIISSDTLKNNFNERSLGCNIYSGVKNLRLNYLKIEDLGSGSDYYRYSLAALQIHGWNNNPESIKINEAIIEKSDRHGVYITGNNHTIKKLTVKKVGLGSVEFNHGLEDASNDEIDHIAALWINKCQNSELNSVLIDCEQTNAKITVNFDEGSSGYPTIIDNLKVINNSNYIKMLPNDLTNIVVRHFEETND